MTTGKDLLDLGFKSGKWFKDALAYINDHGLEGAPMLAYLDTVKPPAELPLLAAPAPFFENIRADSAVEQQNIDQVRQSMALLMRTPTVVTGAVMPDACPAGPLGTIPVGGVVVARQAIHPGMHSADICCSVMLTNLGKIDPKTVLDVAQQVTHFGPGGRLPERQYALPAALRAEFAANPLQILPEASCAAAFQTQFLVWRAGRSSGHNGLYTKDHVVTNYLPPLGSLPTRFSCRFFTRQGAFFSQSPAMMQP